MATSSNGWSVYTSPPSGTLPWITGRVRPGDVQTIFTYLCRRFDAEVENIRTDWSWGWAYRAIRGQTSGFSNHASGTAIDLNAPAHGLGSRGTFSSGQVAAIRRILAELDGTVRWGGDYQSRADEMHFEINSTAAHVAAVAARLTQPEDDMPYTEKQVEDMAYKGAMRALQDAKFDVGREGKWSLSTILKTLLPTPKAGDK